MRFTRLTLIALIIGTVLACLAPETDAGLLRRSNLGTILPSVTDTTGAWPDAGRSNGVGFLVSWTEEDSLGLILQTSLDGGSTWYTFASATIDGGTTGPFFVARACEFSDFSGVGAAKSGGFTNLPIGTDVRALLTPAGTDTISSCVFSFSFSN